MLPLVTPMKLFTWNLFSLAINDALKEEVARLKLLTGETGIDQSNGTGQLSLNPTLFHFQQQGSHASLYHLSSQGQQVQTGQQASGKQTNQNQIESVKTSFSGRNGTSGSSGKQDGTTNISASQGSECSF
eukprot:TRINITY_DN1643_c0_g1_i1.p1 TRINITY_DN1643_c0_g1~~TRINITY_DN1643_c0_g1_i1.p1  ORF type:complete len:130 (-),score=21.70 TRINITY_DN1643_c0_g1_i1:357-746(-)